MNSKAMFAVVAIVSASAAGGWWWYATGAWQHQHHLVKATDENGAVYWTCPMHPQIRLDHPGNCPICGMKLVQQKDPAAKPDQQAATSSEPKVLYWYDPMKPDQHFDHPGKSPSMDMALVPKYAEPSPGGTTNRTLVSIDPRMAQNLGMRTAEARSGNSTSRIEVVGTVTIDENRIFVVEARAAGWVERLEVRATGDQVRAGQVVARLYAPDLRAAQEELALARSLKDKTLIEAAQSRLKLLGVSTEGPPDRKTVILSPQSGVVTELLVRQGAQVTPGVPLMKLADLSRVWIVVDVPESQSRSLAIGTAAEARLKSHPGKTFAGIVEYIYPVLNPETRTVRARIAVANPAGELKPGMYAEINLTGLAGAEVTLVPSEAVIRTGTRNVVLLAETEGRYRPVEVTLGAEVGDETTVLQGIAPGQHVVVSGQFLIDSEASLLGAYQRMEATSQASPSPGATAPKADSTSPAASVAPPTLEPGR